MNKKPFGKKCKCGHLESQHISKKPTFKIPDIPLDVGMLSAHPNISIVERINCKFCNCKKFDVKRNWDFWRGL